MFKHKMSLPLHTLLLFLLPLIPTQIWALSSGITEYSGNPNIGGGNTCAFCHSGGTVAPNVNLSGPTSLEAGSSGTYVLSMSGGQENSAGFNISTNAGDLSATMTGTTVDGGELKHTQAFQAGSAGVEWTFTFNAPVSEGSVTLYASVLSANGDNQSSGDSTQTATLVVTITPAQEKLAPSANAGGPYLAAPGEEIVFDANESADGDGTITRYLWDFGDGSPFGQGVTTAHTYTNEGDYTVTLAATDNDGLTGAVATTVTIATDTGSAQGEALYNQHCFACHGTGGTGGSASDITNSTADSINTAINNIAEMQSISLTQDDVQLIVDFLASGGGQPPPRPTDGPGLYTLFCAACHGSDGRGGSALGVTGAPFPMIVEAIADIPVMQNIDLSLEETQLVADFLIAGGAGGTPTSADALYDVFCAVCHGNGGQGGKFMRVTGASQQMISAAISNVEWMKDLTLDNSQISDIAGYLGAGGEPPLPLDAAGLYDTFCGVCHGSGGHGGKFIAVTGAATQMITEAVNNEPWMQSLQLTTTQQQQITGYLVAGGEPPLPEDGAGLYGVFCAVCHGDDGRGGKFQAVTGAPAAMINDAIANEAWMNELILTQTQVNQIATFLTAGGSGPNPTNGQGLYTVFCSVCHGADGRGGAYKVVTGSSATFINNALNGIGLMNTLSLNTTQVQLVADYLAAGGGGSKPNTGADLYYVYCESCHGPNGNGGPEESVRGDSQSKINSAITGETPMLHLIPYLTREGDNSDTALIADFLNNGESN